MANIDNRKTIRGIDPKLFDKARVASVKAKLPLGQWLNQAILAKLSKK